MNKAAKRYWFAVMATFICPTCKKLSKGTLYTNAGRPEPDSFLNAPRLGMESSPQKQPVAIGLLPTWGAIRGWRLSNLRN